MPYAAPAAESTQVDFVPFQRRIHSLPGRTPQEIVVGEEVDARECGNAAASGAHTLHSRNCMSHTGSTGSTVLIFTVDPVDPV
jgi:hypothetical protein